MRHPMWRLLFLMLVCLALAGLGRADDVVSGRFDLIDHNGNAVTEASYDGKLRLVFFGFTSCPDICPTTLIEVRTALQDLGDEAGAVQPLFFSIDREHDSPERLADYVAAFHPSLVGLTGSAEQLERAARAFNVIYGKTPALESASGRDEIFHTTYLFLMDRDGRFIDVFGYGTKGKRIAETVREYL